MQSMRSIRQWLKRRSPYQALAILAVPFAVVELSKVVALAVVGKGHWLTGTTVMAVAYALSIFVIERMFKIMKPQLLALSWFSQAWRWFVGIRTKTMTLFGYRPS
ncbi:MAG: hypothetical protein QOF09_4435 [Alphaproteobacteria bacterium]|jgi:hypothetical protein|nr:hypothetical protein [Alphaproteobacteria bacterium]